MLFAVLVTGYPSVSLPDLGTTLLSATVLAAVITQVSTAVREGSERSRRHEVTLTAIECEFVEIVHSINSFWEKVESSKDGKHGGDEHVLKTFFSTPYPEGAMGAWASSLRALLSTLSIDQIGEKIQWLYAIESMAALKAMLFDDYKQFCMFEKTTDVSSGDALSRLQRTKDEWIKAQAARLVEFKEIHDRLQLMPNNMRSGRCCSACKSARWPLALFRR